MKVRLLVAVAAIVVSGCQYCGPGSGGACETPTGPVTNQTVTVYDPPPTCGTCNGGTAGGSPLNFLCHESACNEAEDTCSAVTSTWTDGRQHYVCLTEAPAFHECQLQVSGAAFDAEVDGPRRTVTPTLTDDPTPGATPLATCPPLTTES